MVLLISNFSSFRLETPKIISSKPERKKYPTPNFADIQSGSTVFRYFEKYAGLFTELYCFEGGGKDPACFLAFSLNI